jgi:hypothetical protein
LPNKFAHATKYCCALCVLHLRENIESLPSKDLADQLNVIERVFERSNR